MRPLLELLHTRRRKFPVSDCLRALHSGPRRNRIRRYFDRMIFPSRLRWLLLTLFVVVADRATKGLIEARTAEGWHHEVIPRFVELVHSRNPGIAFSMFANSQSPWLRTGLISLSVLFVAVLSWLLLTSKQVSWRSLAGLALLIGGAAGNLTDRIVHGAVTDF